MGVLCCAAEALWRSMDLHWYVIGSELTLSLWGCSSKCIHALKRTLFVVGKLDHHPPATGKLCEDCIGYWLSLGYVLESLLNTSFLRFGHTLWSYMNLSIWSMITAYVCFDSSWLLFLLKTVQEQNCWNGAKVELWIDGLPEMSYMLVGSLWFANICRMLTASKSLCEHWKDCIWSWKSMCLYLETVLRHFTNLPQ